MRHAILFRLLVAIVLTPIPSLCSAAEATPPNLIRSESPHEYLKSLIESFGWAKEGLSRSIEASRLDMKNIESISEWMYQIKLAGLDYAHAANEIAEFRRSNQDFIRESSASAHEAYTALMRVDKQMLELSADNARPA